MRRGSARPATPWALTLILLAGLACWLIGERCARGATVDPPPPPAAPAGIDWGEPNTGAGGGARVRDAQASPAVGCDPPCLPLSREAGETVLVTWTGALALASLAGLAWALWRRL